MSLVCQYKKGYTLNENQFVLNENVSLVHIIMLVKGATLEKLRK